MNRLSCAILVLLAVLFIACGVRPAVDARPDPVEQPRESPGKPQPGVEAKPPPKARSLATLEGPEKGAWRLAFSHDDRTLAAGSIDGTIKVWDVASRREGVRLEHHHGFIETMVFTADGKRLYRKCRLETGPQVWDLSSGKLERDLKFAPRDEFSVFSPDGQSLATGIRGEVKLWDLATGQHRLLSGAPKEGISCLAFSGDSNTLAAAGSDPALVWVKVWKLRGGEPRPMIDLRFISTKSIALSHDGRILATGSLAGGEVTLWDVTTGKKLRKMEVLEAGAVYALAFSPDSRLLASGTQDDKSTHLWDVRTGQRRLVCGGSGIDAVVFSHGGKLLATASREKLVKLWDVPLD